MTSWTFILFYLFLYKSLQWTQSQK